RRVGEMRFFRQEAADLDLRMRAGLEAPQQLEPDRLRSPARCRAFSFRDGVRLPRSCARTRMRRRPGADNRRSAP
ncbi:hypothetical protein ACQKGT_20480, partial [Methylobacterium sp. NPDC052247]|uniref:hypothetical protein n=1 Tax=Methylobacterium sp. NPDC052247 TaxID=3390589 RepID=UPI003D084E6B